MAAAREEKKEEPKSHGLIEEKAELFSLPIAHKFPLTKEDELIIGDLHGNTMKLVSMLIRENVVKGLSKKDYRNLYNICNKQPRQLTASDLNIFESIINRIEPIDPNNSPTITLLGDILADRRSNDYFTLKLLSRMRKIKVPYSILLSNHDSALIHAYEKNGFDSDKSIPHILDPDNSLHALKHLLREGIVNSKEINQLVEEDYLPFVKAMDFRKISEREGIFLTHAPVDLGIIPRLEQHLKLPEATDEENIFNHIETRISKINDATQKILRNKELTTKADLRNPQQNPLHSLMWHRLNQGELRKNDKLGQNKATYLHGHDRDKATELSAQQEVITLDNAFGSRTLHDSGDYTIYYVGKNSKFLAYRLQESSLEILLYKFNSLETQVEKNKFVEEYLFVIQKAVLNEGWNRKKINEAIKLFCKELGGYYLRLLTEHIFSTQELLHALTSFQEVLAIKDETIFYTLITTIIQSGIPERVAKFFGNHNIVIKTFEKCGTSATSHFIEKLPSLACYEIFMGSYPGKDFATVLNAFANDKTHQNQPYYPFLLQLALKAYIFYNSEIRKREQISAKPTVVGQFFGGRSEQEKTKVAERLLILMKSQIKEENYFTEADRGCLNQKLGTIYKLYQQCKNNHPEFFTHNAQAEPQEEKAVWYQRPPSPSQP